MDNFFAHTSQERKEMLDSISVSSVEELFSEIPQQARMKSLDLPEALSEMAVQKEVKKMAGKNNIDYVSFIGGGVYNHFIPACINQVASRYEFLTAYTPYQPEISQGTLQVMYEFQSMMCNLTGMDVSNASLYDAGGACAEAILMASRVTKKRKALISNSLNPLYKTVVKTYMHANEFDIEFDDFENLKEKSKSGEYACVLVQNPDFFGTILDIDFAQQLKELKTLLIICADATSLSVLNPPSEYGADIVVGDIQPLGIPMSFGGPHAGYMTCKQEYVRQMPGRIAGKTLDKDGNVAFTLTLQTREQHIRREKATSNICSNQSLMTLCATLYLSLLGEKGFKQVGAVCANNAHLLADGLKSKGIKVLNEGFYNEFVIEVDNATDFLTEMKKKGIIAGLKLDEKQVLVTVTEMNTQQEIDLYLSSI
ncbi:MAG: aminomethyl-transferring glycine dehydrogenase subunit GcvPA [bacterium]|nr:aminomethyl-transferring glycine dehydrogenase subunit GcvPA [bacterium]